MKKIILGTSAVVVTLVSAFAFTNHNKKFGAATLYTKSGIPLQCHLTTSPKCVSQDQAIGTCQPNVTYYTKSTQSCVVFTGTAFITN